jgi:hypothetical protein
MFRKYLNLDGASMIDYFSHPHPSFPIKILWPKFQLDATSSRLLQWKRNATPSSQLLTSTGHWRWILRIIHFEQNFIYYESFKSARQTIIELVRKSGGNTIFADSSTHRNRPFVFTMPCRWSSFAFCEILWTESFFKKTIFAALRLP